MEQKARPNIVLILADDMGYSDIGCFGAEIETPHLDALAATGLRFTHMCNNARCCPSRAALLTGVYPHQAGIGLMVGNMGRPAYQGYLNEHCVTIAQALKNSGYRTSMSGKWHVGGGYGRDPEAMKRAGTPGYPTPNSRGFDRFYGILEGAGSYYNPITLSEDGQSLMVKPDEEFYLTDRIADKAVQMVGEMKEDPFFLYVAFNAPHWPLHAPPEAVAKYRDVYLKGWDRIREARFEKQRALGLIRDEWLLSPRDDGAPKWEDASNKQWEAMRMAVYAAQVTLMDQGIGRIVSALKEAGILDDTLIVFLSDNGGCAEDLQSDMAWLDQYVSPTRAGAKVCYGNDPKRMPGGEDTYMSYGLPWANVSNTPFRLYKHWIHEGGIASPMVAHWTNGIHGPGRTVDSSLHFIDILPTFLGAAGASYPDSFEGRPVLPTEGEDFQKLFSREPWTRERPIFWEHEGNAGMLQGKWKLVRMYPGPWELYDISMDRTEQRDLGGQEPARLARMAEAYQAWAARTGVVLPEELRG